MVERRSYRSAPPAPPTPRQMAPEPPADSGYEQEEQAPPTRSAPKKTWGNREKRVNKDGEFVNVTGFFPSTSGKADTVVLTPAILKHFDEMNEGDVLGVSANKKTGRLQLWYIKKGK